jgi:putative transposase
LQDQQSEEDKPIVNDTLELTDEEVLEHARSGLEEHLALKAAGYKCSTEGILDVLLGVAATQDTLESVCADLVGTPKPETIRRYLNEQLTAERLPELQQQLNEALAQEVPKRVWRRERDIAIDLHDRPYYGNAPQEEALWVRGRAKKGTTRFHRVATAYVILNGMRFTLAIYFFLPDDTKVTVLKTLLNRVRSLEIPIRRLLLDRGFAGIEVMAYLEQCKQPTVIACPIRGKIGGTRGLCQGRKSYRTQHVFKNATQSFVANMAVCRAFTTAKRTGRMKRRATWLIFILIHIDLPPRQVRRLYRRRFGIETSYRCAAQVRGWTTSRNPAYRFLLLGLSFFVTNVWLHLRWLFTQVPRQGRRYLDVQRLQLARLAKFITRALERRYGCVRKITAPAAPIP